MMALLDVLMNSEPIGGLEIRNDVLRFASLKLNRKTFDTNTATCVELPLPAGVFAEGSVRDTAALQQALRQLRERISDTHIRHLIVSLPLWGVFSRVYTFPPTLQGEKLEETMQLTTGFQLPLPADHTYLDWQQLEQDATKTSVLLSATSREHIEILLSLLSGAGLKTVAIETHPLSYARTLALPEGEAVLVTDSSPEATDVAIIKDQSVRFTRSIPLSAIPKKELGHELDRISDFAATRGLAPTKRIDLADAELERWVKLPPDTAGGSIWAVSLGAATRGILPREDDDLISLMPVDTQTAYQYQKALTFTNLAANLTMGIATFFAVVFLSVWTFAVSREAESVRQLEIVAALPTSSARSDAFEEIGNANANIARATSLLDGSVQWSLVLNAVRALASEDIAITNIALASPEQPIQLMGIAKSRPAIAAFTEALNASPHFSNAVSPVQNLGTREDIPFSVTFGLADPSDVQF